MTAELSTTRLRDIAGYDLGEPLELVHPASSEEVRALVERARRERVALVPCGRRTAYWRPLDLRNAIAVDLSRMNAIAIDGDVVTAGAGALVRHIDDALRAHGLTMPIVPDGFGDSTIGAMVATACAAGRGMGNGPFSRWLTALTVVDGTASLFTTGTAAALSLPPFTRDGLPDLTGCFLGSEGCLGIVCDVSFRAIPIPHLALLRFAMPVDRTAELLALGRIPQYDTFRATCEDGRTWNAEMFVQSPVSAEEAHARALALGRRLAVSPSPVPADLWAGPVDGHEEFARTRRLIGVDAITTYDRGAALASQLLSMMDRCERAMHRRVALYLAPEYVNAGMHLTYALDDEDGPREAAAFPSELTGVVPYRLGRTWGERRVELHRLKQWLDPDGVFNPGHPLSI